MSSPAHWQADLDASRRWMETAGAEGSTVQWIDQDLSGLDLHDVVLVESTLLNSNFSDCMMHGADLSRAMAGGACFDRARLAGARLLKSQLTEAHFQGADASRACFKKSTLDGATFVDAVLHGASFDDANCMEARFQRADLKDAAFARANLMGADLAASDLSGARFEGTFMNAATRLDDCIGLDRAIVESLYVGTQLLRGADARAWLNGHTARRHWSVADFELWALAKMSSPNVTVAVSRLGVTVAEMQNIAAELGAIFDDPGHSAAEYRRVLGRPANSAPGNASGEFAGSFRHEYELPLWPDVVFVVNEDRNGTAWGAGFEGGSTALPDDLAEISPWRWTAERLRREAVSVEVHEEWSDDLDASLSFATPVGLRHFRARFDLGLLQRWESPVGLGTLAGVS
ncbi:MAG: pentapeptide repeat-containing protein, partial [Kofleriaceae bacterium]